MFFTFQYDLQIKVSKLLTYSYTCVYVMLPYYISILSSIMAPIVYIYMLPYSIHVYRHKQENVKSKYVMLTYSILFFQYIIFISKQIKQ